MEKKSKRHSLSFLQPIFFVLMFYGHCRAARCCQDLRWENPVYWVVSRPRGGRFGHPSIHSFVPNKAAFQTASERLCTCQSQRMLLSPAPRINRLKVTYAKVSLQFNGCSRHKEPLRGLQLNQDRLRSSPLTGFPKQLESFKCVRTEQKSQK